MPALHFTQENMPQSTEEFKRILAKSLENTRPMDDFVGLVRRLTLLEQKYGLASDEFYARYQRGEMGDSMEIMEWVSVYEIFRETKDESANRPERRTA